MRKPDKLLSKLNKLGKPNQPGQPNQSGRLDRLTKWKTTLTRRQRILILVVAVVVLFGLLTATVLRDRAVGLVRFISYSESNDEFAHNAQSNSLFLGMGNNLLVCTKNQIQVFSPTGAGLLKESVSMTSPALNAAGDYAVVYDVGGQQLKVIQGDKVVNELELPAADSILCATVNAKGWVAVTSKVSGYKGVVTVYDTSFETVLSIKLSSRYISDAVVTPDCQGVYLFSPGQANGAFENKLLYYTFSFREEPTREVSLGSNVVLSVLSDGKCWVLGDKSLILLDSSGVITASYSYGGSYLKMGSLQGRDFATLFLSPSATGSSGTLTTVSENGEVIGQADLEGQTLALAAQGHDVAVLTTGDIITADRKLTKYARTPNQMGVKNIAAYNDGTFALINSATVSLYFPIGADKITTETQEEGA